MQTVRRYSLLQRGDNVIVAYSGGADSALLLYLFNKNKRILGINLLGLAHVNHGLRGERSQHDEAAAAQTAARYGVEMFLHRAVQQRDEQGNPIGSEAWGRNMRRAFFKELCEQKSAVIATGHNASDVAETVLFRMVRGTGAAGLHGIKPSHECFVRPLIDCSGEEIRRHVAQLGLAVREDESNESNRYARNIIRNEVLTQLRAINPSAERAIIAAATSAGQAHDFLSEHAQRYIAENTPIDLKRFKTLHPALQAEVASLLIKPHCELSREFVNKALDVMHCKTLCLQLKNGAKIARVDGKAVILNVK